MSDDDVEYDGEQVIAYTGPDTLVDRIEASMRRQNLTEAENYGRNRRTEARPPIPVAELLAFEEKWGIDSTGPKTSAIHTTFRRPPITYYQALNRAIDTREALELNPMLVNRLRAHREARVQARASRTFRRTR